MKKEYMIPTIEVIKLQAMNQMLAGSPVLGDEYNSVSDGDPLGREDDFNFSE